MTSPPEDRMSELRDLFFESAGELVQTLNEQALLLEKSPGDAEVMRALRRTVHTLKGDAAACGFNELSELAHEFEDVLALENPAAAPLVPDVALRAADVFTALLSAYSRKKKVPDTTALRAEISRLSEAARNGTAKREELSGSTLTITSLGPLGGVATTPVINRPEVAIIGPNKIVERPIFVGDDIVRAKLMNLSISCDHRVVDGWDAASFVQAVKKLLETPVLLFAD